MGSVIEDDALDLDQARMKVTAGLDTRFIRTFFGPVPSGFTSIRVVRDVTHELGWMDEWAGTGAGPMSNAGSMPGCLPVEDG